MFFVQTNANTQKGDSAMSDTYRVFTVSNEVMEGAEVDIFEGFPAIVIGEDDDTSFSGYAPFSSAVPVEGILDEQSRLLFAEIKKTRKGEMKFLARHRATAGDGVIVVIRATMGYEGFNWITGGCTGWQCRKCSTTGEIPCPPKTCPNCGARNFWSSPVLSFADFPGEILARGQIVSTLVGAGEQIIALVQKGGVFRIGYIHSTSGESRYCGYYVCDGTRITAVPSHTK